MAEYGKMAAGIQRDIERIPVKDRGDLEKFLQLSHRAGPETARQYANVLTHFSQATEKRLLDLDVEGFLQILENMKPRRPRKDGVKGFSKASLETYKRVAKTFYTRMGKGDDFKDLKVGPSPSAVEVETDLLTDQEYDDLKKAANSQRDRAMMDLLRWSGCRAGELVNIKLRDVHQDEDGDWVVSIRRGKTTARTVPILQPGEVLFWIEGGTRAPKPDALLFPNPSGKPLSRWTVYRMLVLTAERAGIKKKVTPHMLRHLCATTFARRNLGLSSANYLLGWKPNSKMFATYEHLGGTGANHALKEAFGVETNKKPKDYSIDPRLEALKALKCPSCGHPTGRSPYCPHCGTALSEEGKQREGAGVDRAVDILLTDERFLRIFAERVAKELGKEK